MIWRIAFYLLNLLASALYLTEKNEKYRNKNMDKLENYMSPENKSIETGDVLMSSVSNQEL